MEAAKGKVAEKTPLATKALKDYTDELALSTFTTPTAAATDANTDYAAMKEQRDKIPALTTTLGESIGAAKQARKTSGTKSAAVKEKEAALDTALAACEALQYKAFQETYNSAVTTRGSTLEKIGEKMTLNRKAKAALKDGSGLENARCERPRSNGDMRDTRGTVCDVEKDLCCGSASKTVGLLQLTVETCQKSSATSYKF